MWATSIETQRIRAAVPETQYHLPVLQIAEDQSQEPLRNLQGNEDPHNDVVVNFVRGFGPVSEKFDDSCGLVGIVSVLEDKPSLYLLCLQPNLINKK